MSKIYACDCGYQWKHGFSGDHDCGPWYRGRIEALENQNAELLAALKDITVLAPAGSLAQHKAYFAIAGCEKTGALQPSTQEVSNE